MAERDRHRPDVPPLSEVLRTPGFAPVFLANALSTWGDYIARLVVAGVVFDRTGSALATAATFAASLLPTLLGRGLLSGLADRMPYRDVLLTSHLTRAALATALLLAVIVTAPITVLLVLVFVLELAAGPSVAAGQVLLTDWFDDRSLYARAFALNTTANQVNQAIGFVLGGSILALIGPAAALFANAATFVVAAGVILAVVPRRRLVEPSGDGGLGFLGDLAAGWRALAGDRVLTSLLGLSILAVPAVVAPEAVAIPYAAQHTDSMAWRGVLMAAPVVGAVVGLVVVGQMSTIRQSAVMRPLALLMPLPLLVTLVEPGLTATWFAWFASGLLQSFMLPLQTTYSLLVEPALRGRLFGFAGAISVAAAGAAYLFAGWASQRSAPAAAVGVCAVLSLGGSVLVVAHWPRSAFTRQVRQAFGRQSEPSAP